MDISTYWEEAWQQLGTAMPAGSLQPLLARYDEPHRHYHTRQHLQECFAGFEALRKFCQRPGEVLMAIWFHDAIYDTHAAGSERASAELADALLRVAGVPDEPRHRIEGLIMATCHQAEPEGDDQAALLDVDLAILGAEPVRYAQYEQQVRAEYAWVPVEFFSNARAKILTDFLAQPTLYRTALFRTRYEAQARANVERAITTLRGG